MDTLLDGLRSVLGVPAFYDVATNAWHYDLMIEYLAGVVILSVVISSCFRLISKVISR